MCRFICRHIIRSPRVLSLLALLFLIVAFTLELIYVVAMPWRNDTVEFDGLLLAAGITGIASIFFMGCKFLFHEAIILWPNSRYILSKYNFTIGILAFSCSLSSVICYMFDSHWENKGYQRMGWSVPSMLASMMTYYMTVGKLVKKKVEQAEGKVVAGGRTNMVVVTNKHGESEAGDEVEEPSGEDVFRAENDHPPRAKSFVERPPRKQTVSFIAYGDMPRSYTITSYA